MNEDRTNSMNSESIPKTVQEYEDEITRLKEIIEDKEFELKNMKYTCDALVFKQRHLERENSDLRKKAKQFHF